jgi:hypothetical protein
MFDTEEQLIQRLLEYFNNKLVFTEVECGYGRADIVIIKNKKAFNDFCKSRNGAFLQSNEEIKIFTYLRRKRKGATFSEILNNHYISEATLKYKILKNLLNINAIFKEGDIYYRNKDFTLFNSDVTAIEGKLSNWQTALEQAIRYQRFASKSYVALDQKFIHRVSIDEFKRYNIGLISVGSKVEEVISPKVTRPSDPTMRYRVAEYLLQNKI